MCSSIRGQPSTLHGAVLIKCLLHRRTVAQRMRDLMRPLSVRRMGPLSVRGVEPPLQSARQAADCAWCGWQPDIRTLAVTRVLVGVVRIKRCCRTQQMTSIMKVW